VTGTTYQDDLANWLDQVTHNLPQRLGLTIRTELSDHVEDAVADMVEQDVPEETAYRRVLSTLGDPHSLARGFKDVHLGRYHYMAATLVCLMIMFVSFGYGQFHEALGWAEQSMAGRILYIVEHAFSMALLVYVVVVFRRLLVWRFDNQAVETPSKIVVGSSVGYLIGNAIAELTVDSWYPVPTFLDASGVVEGAGLLIMHASFLVFGIGFLLMLACSLSTRGKLVKAVAIIGSIQCVSFIVALVLFFLGVPLSSLFGHINALMNLITWPVASVLFLQALFTHRRLPARTA
jgi:hypothetical protein